MPPRSSLAFTPALPLFPQSTHHVRHYVQQRPKMGTDVLVIGGGVIGLSTALELVKNGASVQVINRSPEESATRNAAGMMAAQCERLDGVLARLATKSLELYPDYVQTLPDDVGYTARDDFLIPVLYGEDGDLNYSRDAIQALEPALGPQVRGARTAIGDAHIDNRRLLGALQSACLQLGVELRNDTVARLQISGSNISHAVLQNGDVVNATKYVTAAGAWTKQLLPMIPIRPMKGQMISLRPRNSLSPLPIHVLHGRDAYVVPKSNGLYYIGATVEDVGFDRTPTAGAVTKLLDAATTLVPSFADCAIEEIWAGLRPTTPDLLPIIGNTTYSNLCVATGTFRNGVLFAPAIAKMMAACVGVSNDLSPELNSLLDAFALSRFTETSSTNKSSSSNSFNLTSTSNRKSTTTEENVDVHKILVERVLEDGTREPIKPSKEFIELKRRQQQNDNIIESNVSNSIEEPQVSDEGAQKTFKQMQSSERPEEGFGTGDSYEDVLKFRENAEEKLREGMAKNRAFGRTPSNLEKEGDVPLLMSREDEIAFDVAFAAAEAEIEGMVDLDSFRVR